MWRATSGSAAGIGHLYSDRVYDWSFDLFRILVNNFQAYFRYVRFFLIYYLFIINLIAIFKKKMLEKLLLIDRLTVRGEFFCNFIKRKLYKITCRLLKFISKPKRQHQSLSLLILVFHVLFSMFSSDTMWELGCNHSEDGLICNSWTPKLYCILVKITCRLRNNPPPLKGLFSPSFKAYILKFYRESEYWYN